MRSRMLVEPRSSRSLKMPPPPSVSSPPPIPSRSPFPNPSSQAQAHRPSLTKPTAETKPIGPQAAFFLTKHLTGISPQARNAFFLTEHLTCPSPQARNATAEPTAA